MREQFMSNVNRRILKTIEESKFEENIKELLETLLAIELRNMADKTIRYAEDYDRILRRLSGATEEQEDK
jgi:hypothetical protein